MMRATIIGLLALFLSHQAAGQTVGEQRKAECLERLEVVRAIAEHTLCWAEGMNTAVRSQKISRVRGYPSLARIQLNIRSMVGSLRRTARAMVESAEGALEDAKETRLEQYADDRSYRKMMNDLQDTEELLEDVDEEMAQFIHQLKSGPSMGIDVKALRKECDEEEGHGEAEN